MSREYGKLGQFDVLVDGEVIAGRGRSKEGGFLQRMLSGGWPDPEDVIEKIEAKLRSANGKPQG